MILFILSNAVISLLALSYNKLDNTTINAKLFFSSFAMLCWVIPFSFMRNLFPKYLGVDITWIVPQTFDVINVEVTETTALAYSISLSDVFVLACLIGVLISILRLHRHFKWLQKLKTQSTSTPVRVHNGIPVFTSNSINSAVLIGFRSPCIWINTKLLNSPHLSVILAHESAHKHYKDNYSLLAIELLRNLYWWNPFVRLLTKDLRELIEARCDHAASKSFSDSQYQKQLAALMHTSQADLNHDLSSAVISKNPNIRRLQYLSEEIKMNLISKVFLTTFLIVTILVLAIPVSSLTAIASPTNNEATKDKTQEKTPELGSLLDIKISRQLSAIESRSTKSSEMTVWTNFNKASTIKISDFLEATFQIKELDEKVLLSFDLFDVNQNRKLIGSPRLFTTYGQTATIEWSEPEAHDVIWTINVTPNKTPNPNIN